MSFEINELTGILNEIGKELTNQISSNNSKNEKIDIKRLAQKAHDLDRVIVNSRLPDEAKLMLQKFSVTLVQDSSTIKSRRYEKQDLERVLANLNDI